MERKSQIMKNIKLVLEYDGSRYDGYQRLGKDESVNTIEYKLTEVLKKMTGQDIELNCGCRTENGVHAYGQVVNFKCETDMRMYEVEHYLNRYLPRDIAAIKAEEMPERFHASLNAKSKTYVYRIDTNDIPNVFERKYMYNSFKKLNVDKMKEAAGILKGKHDFAKFTTAKRNKTTVKELFEADIYDDDTEIQITLTANDFMHNMAKLIVGTLIDVGNGKISPDKVMEMLNPESDAVTGPMADACGMFLQSVNY